MRVRLAFAALLSMNVMALHLPRYAEDVFGGSAVPAGVYSDLDALFGYLLLFLSSIVFVLLGVPMLLDAWEEGEGRPGARLLIAIGVAAALVASGWHTVTGSGRSYYDTAVMVLVVVTFGRYAEARARRAASDRIVSALDGLPALVERERGDGSETVPREQIAAGDRVRVRPGEAVCVDGTVRVGSAHLDTGAIDGESRPVAVGPGDRVASGAIALDGEIRVEAAGPVSSGNLARIERSLEAAKLGRPRLQAQADRLASVLMPIVVTLALAVVTGFTARGRFEEGLLRGLSVLLIACPCAFALAPSLGLVAATARAARRGVLLETPEIVERVSRVRTVFFDKTGTLTHDETEVTGVTPAHGVAPRFALGILAALEAASLHPIARGIVRFARSQGVEPQPVEACRVLPGVGVEGTIDGCRYRVSGIAGEAEVELTAGDGASLARATLRERPRSEAAAAIAALKGLGLGVFGLSGDRSSAAVALGSELDLEIHPRLRAEDKVTRIHAARAGGAVMMVGDGINDAPALAAADVGVALGDGSDLSRRHGHVQLTRNRLLDLPELVADCRRTTARVRFVLVASLAYNAVGVALAVAGWLAPPFAASAMVVSSLLVVSMTGKSG